MTRIILHPDDAKRMADGALAAVAKDDPAIVLTGALLELSANGAASMVATDRYRVHRIHAKAIPDRTVFEGYAEHSVQLTADALKWLSANSTKLGRFSVVWITSSPAIPDDLYGGSVRIEVRIGDGQYPDEHGMLAFAGLPLTGNFPPVQRLFDDAVPATDAETVRLTTSLLAGLTKLQKRKGDPVDVTQSAPKNAKSGPTLFRFREVVPGSDEIYLYAEAVIQPQIASW